jgi:hypothetical protein
MFAKVDATFGERMAENLLSKPSPNAEKRERVTAGRA